MKGRFIFITGVLIFCLLGVASRLVYLQVVEQHFLKKQGQARALRVVNTPAYRGIITDRNDVPLAVSTPVDAVWVNPKVLDTKDPNWSKIIKLLGLNLREINQKVDKKRRFGFLYLKRQVNPFLASQIKALKVTGVHLDREYRRYYPDAEVMSHVIGFTNIDNQGQEGLELAYNDWLTGKEGKKTVLKDLRGNYVDIVGHAKPAVPGHDLKLSIDRRIQYIAYTALKEAVLNNHADGGSAVVMDVKTGELLAMVNQPSYNPNNRQGIKPAQLRNRSVTDTFEPGSVIKPFGALIGLKSGKYTPDTIVDTNPGWYRLDRHIVRDNRNYGDIDLRYVLMKSSNVGISRVVLSLPDDELPLTLRHLGFGQQTGIEFPGERSGVLPDRVRGFMLATLSFGYGMSSTLLQLAQAYQALANDGIKETPTLLYQETKPEGEKIIEPLVSEQISSMLTSVVEGRGGTGSRARVHGYHIAGKTGTVRKAIAGGYSDDSYINTFVGYAPSTRPRYVVAVTIDNPEGNRYAGGTVAAPVFTEIMSQTLRLMNVTPDNIPKSSS